MARTIPIRSKDNTRLAGSRTIGADKDVPQPAPLAAGAPTTGVAVGTRPAWFADMTVQQAFTQAGVHDARSASTYLAEQYLAPDGSFPVSTTLWRPMSPGSARSLLYGNLDLYRAECADAFHDTVIDTVASASAHMEARFPGSGDPTRALLTERATEDTTEQRFVDVRPIMEDGRYAVGPHPFQQRLNPQTLCYEPGEPTTVQDVVELLERPDARIASAQDLATAAFLQGPVSLRSGRWTFDTAALEEDILQAGLDAESTYQALALTFSHGRSTNSGFDAVWQPACGPRPSTRTQAWLREHSRNGEWFAFGQWACGGA